MPSRGVSWGLKYFKIYAKNRGKQTPLKYDTSVMFLARFGQHFPL